MDENYIVQTTFGDSSAMIHVYDLKSILNMLGDNRFVQRRFFKVPKPEDLEEIVIGVVESPVPKQE